MSKDKLTKKDMKTDELERALEGARDFVVTHKTQTWHWALVAGAAVAVVALVWWGLSLRSSRLDARLSDALGLYDAPLVSQGASPVAGGKVFKDAAERQAAVKKELEGLANDAPSSDAGRAARVLLLSMEGGTNPPAKLLDGARDLAAERPGSLVSGAAAAAYLDAEAAAGRAKDAIATAKGYLDSSSSPLPKDVLLFTLGRLSEKVGQVAEAKTYYQRLVSDYPDSPMRFDAQQKVQGL